MAPVITSNHVQSPSTPGAQAHPEHNHTRSPITPRSPHGAQVPLALRERDGVRVSRFPGSPPASAPPHDGERRFRDRLREDPTQREAYVARKREILAQGITHSGDYSEAKGTVIEGILKKDS
nr:GrpB family protein [Archangium sp. Cb G35]